MEKKILTTAATTIIEQLSTDQLESLIDYLTSMCKPVTFRDWACRWLEVYQQGRIKDNTYWGNYKEPVTLHLTPYFGDQLLTDIKPIDIAAFFKEKSQTHALETLKKLRACLKGIFETAVDNGLLRHNPVTSTLKLSSKIPPKEKHTWSQWEYNIAFDFARQQNFTDILVLMETGISRSELLGLVWDDFDPQRRVLHLTNGLVQQRNSETGHVELVHDGLKNSYRRRDVPISTEITARLLSLPRIISVGGDVRRNIPPHLVSPKFIFHAPEGGPYNPPNWYHRRFRTFMDELHAEHPEVRLLTPHELRHTRATLLKDAGKDLYSIARLLGHSDLEMLYKRYAHDNVEALRQALDIQ